jgi:Protein of unknown function (DUF4054)
MTVTADSFVERFPVFEGRDDQIELLLLEAAREVDDSWEAADVDFAIMYWVAHSLVMEDTADSLPVTSESIGPIRVSYGSPQNENESYARTEYGRRFLSLRDKNFRGPVVA